MAETALSGTAMSRLEVLRRDTTAADRPSSAVARTIGTDPYDPERTLDVEQAKAIPSDVTDAPAWLVPAEGRLCLFLPDPVDGFGATCQKDDAAINGRLRTTLVGPSFPGGGSLNALVVPDGVEVVTVADADGTREVAVRDNVAVFRLREGRTISYGDEAGRRVEQLVPIPEQIR